MARQSKTGMASMDNGHVMTTFFKNIPKGQLISKCPIGVIVWTKIPTNFFTVFLPWPLKRGQIKKINALYYTN